MEKEPDLDRKATKKELIEQLELVIKSYNNLPEHVLMYSNVNQVDFLSMMLIILSILKAEN